MHILLSLVAFIITLGILITVHEFCHFWVARRCGVKVERFSVGFGKALWCHTDSTGTEYVIALIPLGGYVKMLDERVEAVAPELRHQSFNNKTIWQRAAIITAGSAGNFIFAVFIWWLVFIIGVPGVRPIVEAISHQSIAEQANIYPGMEVKSIDGTPTPDWDSVRLALIDKIGNIHMNMVVSSIDSSVEVHKKLDLRQWQFEPDKQDPIITLGIIPVGQRIEPVLTEILPDSAAQKAGLQTGDRLVKVDGNLLDSWQTFVMQVRDKPGVPLELEVERNSRFLPLTLIPDVKLVNNAKPQGVAGVVPKIIPLQDKYKTLRQYEPIFALYQAWDKTWQLTKLTVGMLGKLIRGDVKLSNLSGPISIAQGAGVSAEHGLVYYLMFLAFISINLGIVNLFPLPVLDGGHLLFLMIEKLKGEPVSQRVQDFSYRIGSVLLVLLMGLALFNDFSRL